MTTDGDLRALVEEWSRARARHGGAEGRRGWRRRRRSRGVWCCQPYLGTRADGKPNRPYRSFPDAEDEAQALEMARAWVSSLTNGGEVASMLFIVWLIAVIVSGISDVLR